VATATVAAALQAVEGLLPLSDRAGSSEEQSVALRAVAAKVAEEVAKVRARKVRGGSRHHCQRPSEAKPSHSASRCARPQAQWDNTKKMVKTVHEKHVELVKMLIVKRYHISSITVIADEDLTKLFDNKMITYFYGLLLADKPSAQ